MTDDTQDFEPAGSNNSRGAEELLPLVYDELRRLSASLLAREGPGHSLAPTGLVHEAYLRLSKHSEHQFWDNPGHFFAAAAEAMRRILIEWARAKQCQKRGGSYTRQKFDALEVALPTTGEDFCALNEALERLEQAHPRLAELVKLRYFAGLTINEAANILGISPRTANSDWTYARAWLLAQLAAGEPLAADVTREVR